MGEVLRAAPDATLRGRRFRDSGDAVHQHRGGDGHAVGLGGRDPVDGRVWHADALLPVQADELACPLGPGLNGKGTVTSAIVVAVAQHDLAARLQLGSHRDFGSSLDKPWPLVPVFRVTFLMKNNFPVPPASSVGSMSGCRLSESGIQCG